jgi:tRNA_anti-like
MYRLLFALGLTVAPVAAGAPPEDARLPIETLVGEFQTNEPRAEAMFVGQEIIVTGQVRRVVHTRNENPQRPERGTYTVELDVKPLPVSDITVRFLFDETDRKKLMDLRAGQPVTIRGKCSGPVVQPARERREAKDSIDICVRGCKFVHD